MGSLKVSRVVNAPVEKTFLLFTDFANAAERVSGIESVNMLTDGPVGVGTRFTETRIMFGKSSTEEMEVTKFEPNKLCSVEAESCGAKFVSTFRFLKEGPNTKVEMDMLTQPISFFAKIMSPLTGFMAGSVKKIIESDMNDLAKLAEANDSVRQDNQ